MKSELETNMLKPAILALLRQILTVAGTALVANGLVRSRQTNQIGTRILPEDELAID
jgi:hypothetical protein